MANKSPLHLLSACRIQSLIKRDIVTVEEYARALLDHIKKRDPVIHAWAYLDCSLVLAQAKELDKIKPLDRGPLHGIAIGIKDVLLTKDMPTCYGSPIYRDEPAHGPDATVVAALRGAGALIMGKTHTTEFAAANVGGPCVNSYDTQRTPGGSSSGSAAAVADYQVPLAIGTQTGGSMVRPGAYCGIYALKNNGITKSFT
ncbi:biuret amidohydrolase [Trichoderma arundinaceum]|uniref:Biuret amidohydrolase n=1 Tax=Trichoderma arundinaceum TaxID=490622 RepID=A0A395NUE8_TRIAR|nr:biuret amidohydrolase [Trichoderma arundinaceum]